MANKHTWIIGIGGTEIDDVVTYLVHGTANAVKKHLAKLVRDDKREDPEAWDYGTTSIKDIEESSFGRHFYGYAVFSSYHIDYAAEMMPEPEDIKEIK